VKWRGALAAALFILPVSLSASEPFVPGFQRLSAHETLEEGGRLLYNELGCANCHGGETGLPQRRGPQLAGLTQRAQVIWRFWLTIYRVEDS
jgi:cytochrome c2